MSASLAVPSKQPTRYSSSSSLRSQIEKQDELAPISRSRRNSDSNLVSGVAAAANVEQAKPQTTQQPDFLKQVVTQPDTTILYAGSARKPYSVLTSVLIKQSPYVTRLLAKNQDVEQLACPDIDEFGMAMFVHWIKGGKVDGPTDFHSFAHFLGLYCAAIKFEVEALQNMGK